MTIARARAVVLRTAGTAAVIGLALVVPAEAGTSTVTMREDDGFHFKRAYKVIFAGDAIEWSNQTSDQHTVTAFPGSPEEFDSSPNTPERQPGLDPCVPPLLGAPRDCIDPDDVYRFTFDEAGTYNYYCKAHGDASATPDASTDAGQPCGMCGTIEVKAKPAPTPPRRDRPTERASPAPEQTTKRSPSPSPSAKAKATGTAGAIAAGSGGSGGDGAGARTVVALSLVVALGGAGYWTWRRFLASP